MGSGRRPAGESAVNAMPKRRPSGAQAVPTMCPHDPHAWPGWRPSGAGASVHKGRTTGARAAPRRCPSSAAAAPKRRACAQVVPKRSDDPGGADAVPKRCRSVGGAARTRCRGGVEPVPERCLSGAQTTHPAVPTMGRCRRGAEAMPLSASAAGAACAPLAHHRPGSALAPPRTRLGISGHIVGTAQSPSKCPKSPAAKVPPIGITTYTHEQANKNHSVPGLRAVA